VQPVRRSDDVTSGAFLFTNGDFGATGDKRRRVPELTGITDFRGRGAALSAPEAAANRTESSVAEGARS